MKDVKTSVDLGKTLPLDKSTVLHKASESSIEQNRAVTVLSYLHGVKESKMVLEQLQAENMDVDLIELTCLKPFDMETVKASLSRTHKVVILDESTMTGGVGASISAFISEQLYDELDAPVKRLCMDDAPVPYASSMEKAVVKRGEDLVVAVADLANNRY